MSKWRCITPGRKVTGGTSDDGGRHDGISAIELFRGGWRNFFVLFTPSSECLNIRMFKYYDVLYEWMVTSSDATKPAY